MPSVLQITPMASLMNQLPPSSGQRYGSNGATQTAKQVREIMIKGDISFERDENVIAMRDEDLEAVSGGLGGQSDGYMEDTAGGHTTFKPV